MIIMPKRNVIGLPFYLLVTVLLLVMVSATARAQYSTTSDGNGGLIITGYTGGSGPVNIPATIANLPVTGISMAAFENTTITTAAIPASVTSIGLYAFAAGTLTAITVDPANPSFSSLNGVLFNKNQTTLIQYPHSMAGTSYTIPNTVTSVYDDAFDGCTGLSSITIPSSVTSIGNFTFSSTGLTSLTIPTSVTSLGQSAFSYCANLTSLTLPGSLTSLSQYAFAQCTGLTSLTIPTSVTNIGPYAFSGCTSLTSVTIPASVTVIGSGAFDNGFMFVNSNLANAIFLGNAPTMGTGVFRSPAANFTVTYSSGATGFESPTWLDSSGDTYPAMVAGSDAFGGTVTANNLKYSSWFGYYLYGSYPLVYEYNLGYEDVFPSGGGVYLYDYTSGHFWYTQSSYFPFVYDFTLNAFLYYYQANTPKRHFYDFGTNQVISE